MKFTNIKCVTADEVRTQMQALAMKHGRRSAADMLGVSYNVLSNVLAGFNDPGRKSLAHFGLEPKTVYVKQEGASNG